MTVKCIVCGEPKQAFVHFAQGWACRFCTESASQITAHYVIRGMRFLRLLKSPIPALKRTAVAANDGR